MKRFGRLVGGIWLAALAACETTGDPGQDGLFGWSESKARERQAQKQSHVAGAETELAQTMERGTALQSRHTTAERNLAMADVQRSRADEYLRTQQIALVAKTERLEADSPTAATASRARSLRLKVNTIVAQTLLPPRQRAERLYALEAEIDAAQARLKR